MSFSYRLPMISGKSNSTKTHHGVIVSFILVRVENYNYVIILSRFNKKKSDIVLCIFIVSFSANATQIDAAKAIVKAITFKYSPDDFDNPSLQKHYANIEAMALDRDAPEEVDDLTRECS